MTVEGRSPERKASIAAMISSGLRSRIRGTGVFTAALAAWQPEQEAAPGGGPAAIAPAEKTKGSTSAPTRLATAAGDPLTPA
jgi:hypothetical protein